MPWLSHRGVLVNLRGLYYDAIAIGALFGLAILGGRALIETLGWPRIFVSAGALAMLGWSIRCLIRRRSVPSLPFTPATRPCRTAERRSSSPAPTNVPGSRWTLHRSRPSSSGAAGDTMSTGAVDLY